MSYISRKYYESRGENPSVIWQYLDCVQKVAYFQFQNSSIDMEEIFCDDLNIRIVERDNEILISRNCLKTLDQFCTVNSVTVLENAIEYIKEKIDSGFIVGLNTYFYDIPNFIWYHREGYSGDRHICMVVGYDENNLWLTDVPTNMISEYLTDQHITIIPNSEMQKYLDKKCIILIFQEKENQESGDLTDLMEMMLQEYSTQPYNEDGGVVWKGKFVFERLLYLLQIEDPRVANMELYHGAYMATIISGRRELLRRNILKKYGATKETSGILEMLETCVQKWEVYANKILVDVVKKGFHNPKREDLYDIYRSESLLMDHMERFIRIVKRTK